MQNNFLILCFLFLLIGCSSKEEMDLKNYKNVFKNNDEFSKTKISEMVSNYQTIYEDKTIGNYYKDLAIILSVMKDNKSNFS